jgi:hypothetical protein
MEHKGKQRNKHNPGELLPAAATILCLYSPQICSNFSKAAEAAQPAWIQAHDKTGLEL